MRLPLAGTAALLLMLATASGAVAETRHVSPGGTDAGDCADATAPCGTVAYAVGVSAPNDTIQIAAGEYKEAATVMAPHALSLVGAGSGPGGTLLRGPDGSGSEGETALELKAGGSLRSIRVQGGAGDSAGTFIEFGGDGVRFEPSVASSLEVVDAVLLAGDRDGEDPVAIFEPVSALAVLPAGPTQADVTIRDSVVDGAGASGAAGAVSLRVEGPGARIEVFDSQLGRPLGGSMSSIVDDGAELVARSSLIAASAALSVQDASAVVEHSRIEGRLIALRMRSPAAPTEVVITDSLVTGGAVSLPSFKPTTVAVETGAGKPASLVATGSTFVGGGEEPVIAAQQDPGAGPATVALRNSIAHHLPAEVPTADLQAEGATITASHSSYTTRVEKEGGTVTPPGSGTNVIGDPLFVDPAAGNFALQPASPLIDRGDPALVHPAELDLAGSPRSLDGNGDCVAAPDIGAFELTGPAAACADPPPSVSGFRVTNKAFAPKGKAGKRARSRAAASAKGKRRRVKRGTTFVYRLSEPARVTITIERRARGRRVGKGRKARCVKPRRGKATPRCVRFVRVGALSAQKGAGRQTTPFSGRLKGKPLAPGRYRATIVATDPAGQKSPRRRVSFRVVSFFR